MVGEGAPQSPPSESSQKNRRSKIARDGALRWCAPAGPGLCRAWGSARWSSPRYGAPAGLRHACSPRRSRADLPWCEQPPQAHPLQIWCLVAGLSLWLTMCSRAPGPYIEAPEHARVPPSSGRPGARPSARGPHPALPHELTRARPSSAQV
jgi:hypothetical protein